MLLDGVSANPEIKHFFVLFVKGPINPWEVTFFIERHKEKKSGLVMMVGRLCAVGGCGLGVTPEGWGCGVGVAPGGGRWSRCAAR